MGTELVDEAGAEDLLAWLDRFLGEAWIDEQLDIRAARADALGRWSPNDLHGNPLIDAIAAVRPDRENGDLASALARPAGSLLLGSASNVRHVVGHLSAARAASLQRLLRGSHARGYLYQCRIAAHYVRDNYRLVSFSLGEDPSGDVVVEGDAGKVEHQCKALALGAGRRIGNQTFNSLAARILNGAAHVGC